LRKRPIFCLAAAMEIDLDQIVGGAHVVSVASRIRKKAAP
jgi:hypothetical protein